MGWLSKLESGLGCFEELKSSASIPYPSTGHLIAWTCTSVLIKLICAGVQRTPALKKGQSGSNEQCLKHRLVDDLFGDYTSSTAAGGGGSFKNRTPIGEVSCCDAWMAEPIHWWTKRWLELCFLEWLQWLRPQMLDVVWCSAAVVVVVV